MDANRQTRVGVREAPPRIDENLAGGPLAASRAGTSGYQRTPRRITLRSRLERAGFWIVVAAAIVVLLLLLGVILPPVVGGLVWAFYISAFVGGLTLMNLQRASGWANTVLGRRVFPVVNASNDQLWKMAGVNAGLSAAFVFFMSVLASFIGPFLAGFVVFGGLIAAGVFYNRARKVIIKP